MDYAQKIGFCVELSNELNVPKRMTVEEINEWIKTDAGRDAVVSQLLSDKSTLTKLIAIEAADEAEFVG